MTRVLERLRAGYFLLETSGQRTNKGMDYFTSQFNVLVHCGDILAAGSRDVWFCCIHGWEPESDECWYSTNFLLFVQSGKTLE